MGHALASLAGRYVESELTHHSYINQVCSFNNNRSACVQVSLGVLINAEEKEVCQLADSSFTGLVFLLIESISIYGIEKEGGRERVS